MSSYNFTKSGVLKFSALDRDLRTTISTYDGANYNDPSLTVYTTAPLSQQDLTTLTDLVNNYVDPEFFLTLSYTSTDTTFSEKTNSTTPDTVQSFFYSTTGANGNGTFNAIKSVIEYSTNNVAYWSNFSGSLTATFSIKCYTRDYVLTNDSIDITDIANTWKSMALADPIGSIGQQDKVYRTFMVEGLRNYVANYDCVWVYVISVSNPNVYMCVQAKQMLYYDIQ